LIAKVTKDEPTFKTDNPIQAALIEKKKSFTVQKIQVEFDYLDYFRYSKTS